MEKSFRILTLRGERHHPSLLGGAKTCWLTIEMPVCMRIATRRVSERPLK